MEGTVLFGTVGFSRLNKPGEYSLAINSRKMELSLNNLIYQLLT